MLQTTLVMKLVPTTIKQSCYFLLLFMSFTLFSCKKDKKELMPGPPHNGLQVQVLEAKDVPSAGAVVKLYLSEEDRTAEENALTTEYTNVNGIAFFGDLDEIMYYIAVKRTYGNGAIKTGEGSTVVKLKAGTETGVTIFIE
jgi:hypothetical protein